MTKRDRIGPTDLAGAPLARMPASAVPPWPSEGSMTIGVICGVTLSLPLWAGVIGATRALVAALRTAVG